MEKMLSQSLLDILVDVLVHDRLHSLAHRGAEYGNPDPDRGDQAVIEVLKAYSGALPRVLLPMHDFFSVSTIASAEYRNGLGESAEDIAERYDRHGNCHLAFRAHAGTASIEGGIVTPFSDDILQEIWDEHVRAVTDDRDGVDPAERANALRFPIFDQFISIPGVLRMFPSINTFDPDLGVPVQQTFRGGVLVETETRLGAIQVHPTVGQGDLQVGWSQNWNGMKATYELGLPGIPTRVEIFGFSVPLITTRVRDARAVGGLRARTSGGRVFWDLGVAMTARIDEDRHGGVRASSQSAFRALAEDQFDGRIPHVNDDSRFDRFSTGPEEEALMTAIDEGLDSVAEVFRTDLALPELAGHGLGALPLRPDPFWNFGSGDLMGALPQAAVGAFVGANLSFNREMKKRLGSELYTRAVDAGAVYEPVLDADDFEAPALKDYLLLLAHGPLVQDLQASMTGLQSLAHVTPFADLAEAAGFAADLMISILLDAASAPAIRQRDAQSLVLDNFETARPNRRITGLTRSEVNQLLSKVYLRKLSEAVLNRLEYSHLGDRTDFVSSAKVTGNTPQDQALVFEAKPLREIGAPTDRVRTMQYRFRLAQLDIDETALPELPDRQKRQAVVQYRVMARHEGFPDQQAEVIDQHKVTLDLMAESASFGRNASHMVLLELPTDSLTSNLDVEVDVALNTVEGFRQIDTVDLGRLTFTVPVHAQTGLNTQSDTGDSASGFSATRRPLRDQRLKGQLAYTLHGRLEQLPLSQRYEKIRVAVQSYALQGLDKIGLKPTIPGFSYRLSALLDGAVLGRDHVRVSADDQSVAARRAVTAAFQSVLLSPEWSGYVTYDADEVGRTEDSFGMEFQLEIDGQLHRLNATFPRFARAEGAVGTERGEMDGIDSSVEVAVDQGAVTRWGIPVGLDSVVHTLASDDGLFSVTVKVSRDRFAPEDTPPDREPIKAGFALLSIDVHDDLDPEGGRGEMRFWPATRTALNSEGTLHTDWTSLGLVARNVNSGDTIQVNNAPFLENVPREGGEIQFRCKSVERDPFADDRPGTVRVERRITDTLREQELITTRASGGERAYFTNTETRLQPIASQPLLRIKELPRGMRHFSSAKGLPVTLQLDCTFCDTLTLFAEVDGRLQTIEEFRGAGRREVVVKPVSTTRYHVEAKIIVDGDGHPLRSDPINVVI